MRVSSAVRGLSDAELLCSLNRVMRLSRATTAELLAHLGEVEARRLYLRASCGSMFKYCIERLGLDEGAAYMRITAARQARRFPVILEMVADGRLHLAGVCLLARHLTDENHRDLLGAATGKSKRTIEQLLADREPKPDAPPRVRKLPEPPRPDVRQEPLALAPAPLAASPQQPEPPRAPTREPSPAASTTEPPRTTSTTEPSRTPSTTEQSRTTSTTEPSSAPSPAAAPAVPSRALANSEPPAAAAAHPSRRDRGLVAPLGQRRHRVELTASDSLVDKLDRARALLSHTHPGCDIADVIERAVTMLVERLLTRRFGARRTKKATTRAATTGPRTADPVEASGQAPLPSIESEPAGAEARATPTAPSVPSKPSRYVPAQVRRAVYERDGARCAHIDTEGRRCTEQRQLEIDHIVPWALGGPSTVDNLRLACRGHNAQAARQAFGAGFIERRIERRRETLRGPDPPVSSRAAAGYSNAMLSTRCTSEADTNGSGKQETSEVDGWPIRSSPTSPATSATSSSSVMNPLNR
jgi:5-methylcytosine-specific restriction endonuclease McrA